MMNHTTNRHWKHSRRTYGQFFIAIILFISGVFVVNAAGFPVSQSFSGTQPADWVLRSDAVWDTTVSSEQTLRLTTAAADQNGLGFYDSSFSSNNGIVAEFRYYANEGDGADGIAFFLVDGDQVDENNISAGAYGGSLGYAQNDTPTDGIPHAYLGVGFDEFGNFAANNEGKEGGLAGAVPDSVVLRGSGNGTTGYQYLTSIDISSAFSETIDGGWRQARVTILPHTGSSTVRVEMSFDDGATWDTVIDNYTYNEAPPDNLKLGFTGSTGGSTNVHAIGTLDVTLPVDLQTTIDTAPAGPYQRGDTVVYSYDVANNGPNDTATTSITNNLPHGPGGFTNVQWTAVGPGNATSTGTSTTISPFTISLANGESVSVEVTADIGDDVVDTDDLSHTLIAEPGSDETDPNPNAARLDIAISTDVPTQAESDARDVIETYAASGGTSTTPTVNDYTNAGVSGVDGDNLNEVNRSIAEKEVDEVNTVTKIQSTATVAGSVHTIKAYGASNGASSTPTVNDYTNAGVSGVDGDNLNEVNQSIANDNPQTVSEISSTVDTAIAIYKIKQYAATNGTSSVPTVHDYATAGISGVTNDTRAEINQMVAAKTASEMGTLAKIEAAVAQEITALSRSTPTTSTVVFGCNDPDATNYNRSRSHRQTLCDYGTEAPSDNKDWSAAKLRERIAELRTQIASLQNDLTDVSASHSSSGNISLCTSFTRDLERGMQGEDVRCLQQAMNALGFTLAETGLGSPGNETIYFAGLTDDAVRRYQEANRDRVLTPIGLRAPTGYFGPQTLAAIEADMPF